jgi:hypothetical protein
MFHVSPNVLGAKRPSSRRLPKAPINTTQLRCNHLCQLIKNLRQDLDALVETTPAERQHYDFINKGIAFDPTLWSNIGSHLIGLKRRFTTGDMRYLQGLAEELVIMREEAKQQSAHADILCAEHQCNVKALESLYRSFREVVNVFEESRAAILEDMRSFIRHLHMAEPSPDPVQGLDIRWFINAIHWAQSEGVLLPGRVTSGDIIKALETPSLKKSAYNLSELFGTPDTNVSNFMKFFNSERRVLARHGIVYGPARFVPPGADLRRLVFRQSDR